MNLDVHLDERHVQIRAFAGSECMRMTFAEASSTAVYIMSMQALKNCVPRGTDLLRPFSVPVARNIRVS